MRSPDSKETNMRTSYYSNAKVTKVGTDFHFSAVLEKEGSSKWTVTEGILNGICEGKTVSFKTKKEAVNWLTNLGYRA